ncbi:MAG: hypothetical protein U9N73_01990 [Candidatus Auribacterota bacterium]|nr:hypothetical protein [Candidatus Auribacterota bacterium]
MKNNLAILAIILAAIFFLLTLLSILHHEMWRDELHSWLIARDSSSISDLLHNKSNEGHPALWYLCLYSISRFTDDPIAMQIFHLLIATGSVYLFIRFAPFTRLEKFLFIFGYYPFFEYAVLSRNYAAGILCVIAFCIFFRRRDKNHIILSLLLFLMMQTSFHGMVIAGLLGILLIFLRIFHPPEDRDHRTYRRQSTISVVILLAGVALCLHTMIPPSNCGIYTREHTTYEAKRAVKTLTIIWKSYIPIPYFFPGFWNTNFLDHYRNLEVILGIILFFYFLLSFARKIPILLVYLSGTVIYLLFHYIKFHGYNRHHGHLFLLLIICLWLSHYIKERVFPFKPLDIISGLCRKSLVVVLPLILAANLFAALYSIRMDWNLPFTASTATIEYIREKGLVRLPIAGDVDDAILAFPAYLRRSIYYPRTDHSGTFVIYDSNIRWRKMMYWGILKRIEKLQERKKEDILIILNYRLTDRKEFKLWNEEIRERSKKTGNSSGMLEPVREFTDTIVPDEHYYLYLMKYENREGI